MTFNQILDDYAKRGLFDGNLVARLSAAHKREVADALDTGAFVEAAHKREKATTEKSSAVGNVAELREALEKVSRWLEGGLAYCHRRRVGEVVQVPAISAFYVLDAVNAALAEPPRNCDVGSAEEQIKRWEEFCIAHHEYWKPPSTSLTAIQRCNCPCLEGNGCNYFIWAQMPYEEGEAK